MWFHREPVCPNGFPVICRESISGTGGAGPPAPGISWHDAAEKSVMSFLTISGWNSTEKTKKERRKAVPGMTVLPFSILQSHFPALRTSLSGILHSNGDPMRKTGSTNFCPDNAAACRSTGSPVRRTAAGHFQTEPRQGPKKSGIFIRKRLFLHKIRFS